MPAGASAFEASDTPEKPEPAHARAAGPQAAQAPDRFAPDAYAVGVRVLRIAPAWLLSTTTGFALLILILSWMRAGEGVAAVAAHIPHNDARSSKSAHAPEAPQSPRARAPRPEEAPQPSAPAVAPSEPVNLPAPADSPKTGAKPHAAPPAPAAETPAPATGKFTVQVGSFNNRSEANESVSALRAAGFEARSTAVEIPGRGTWYRVQVGRFADRASAAQGLASARAKGVAAGAIVLPLKD